MHNLKSLFVVFILLFAFSTSNAQRSVSDLPLNIVRAKNDNSDKLIIFITGDGGWNSFSQQLVNTYAAHGLPVVALNSLKYFWKKKSPQEAANDIAALVKKYAVEWQKKKIILSGYSFGADVIPFIYRRLPDPLKDKVSLLQLLSPASFTDFEIHVSDLFGAKDPVRSMNIGNELKMIDNQILCYYGNLEEEKPLANQQKDGFRVIILAGDHHYKNSFTEIARAAAGK